mgnify:CR=1 FL=1
MCPQGPLRTTGVGNVVVGVLACLFYLKVEAARARRTTGAGNVAIGTKKPPTFLSGV